jgi:N-acetylmuramoyl-L-alanine amidase
VVPVIASDSRSREQALKVKFTPVHAITLFVLSAPIFFAIPASSAPKSLSAPFDTTFAAYQELSADPGSTRDQWLRIIRSFVRIHQTKKLNQTANRSLFFAGRACLALYRRSGKKADIDEAIRHLNSFVRMNRSGPYLILGLQELKEAHLLKRRLVAGREEQAARPSPAVRVPKTIGRSARGPERLLAEQHVSARPETRPTACADAVLPVPPSDSPSTRASEQGRPEPAPPQPNALCGQSPADGQVHGMRTTARPRLGGASASSGYNCTGNPFFGARGRLPGKPAHPIVSASLPPSTMNDAPRPLRSAPAETAPPATCTPESAIEEPQAASPGPQEKTPMDEPAKETRQEAALAPPFPARPVEPESPRGDGITTREREEEGLERKPDSPSNAKGSKALSSPVERLQKYVVVIDPGHGGKDPGATSNDGLLKEKEITLRIANRVKELIERTGPGVSVALTRTDDIFLPVQERTALANSLNADLFVSIHCNGAEDASSRGIETYYLSKASSKKAMASAARENGIPADRMSDIDATLLDLLMDSKKSESVKLAETVHNALIGTIAGANSPGRNRGVKRAPFYVLLGAKMPAILIECGFINGKERESLKDPCFLDSLAEGVTGGIENYLQGLGDKG